jgi:pimeloyl-ACP methyl ester carboxylesterase
MGNGQRHFASTRDGIKIRYELRGQGAPLALIMGFSGSGRAWSEQFLKLLEPGFRLLVIDNRGTGESDKPGKPWTMADMEADVVSVMDHAGADRSHVFGVSMGGMIAQALTLNDPNRVRGLVLGCTDCGARHSIAAAPDDLANLIPAPGLSREEVMRRALSVACSKAFVESSAGKDFIERMVAEMEDYPITPMQTYALQFQAISGFDSFDRLKTIKAPTLVITGDQDLIIPHQNSGILAREIPGANLHVVPGAGHMFVWEALQQVADTVGGFLSKIN